MMDIKSCGAGHSCPYVAGQDVFVLKRERDYLKARVFKLEKVLIRAETELERLRTENQQLKDEKEALKFELNQLLSKVFKPRKKVKSNIEQPKRGAPLGHRGNTRRRPTEITEYVKLVPENCDKCGAKVKSYEKKFDEHVVEEIAIKKRVILYHFHYGYCVKCKKIVLADKRGVIPNSRIGPLARALAGYLRYQGLPYRKVARIFNDIFDIKITHPSLLSFDTKQAMNGGQCYELIKEKIRNASYVHGDETGWRVNGANWWLWTFPNKEAVIYHIDKSRGSEVVERILGKEYQGTLISDFYSAYNKLNALAKQRCLGHLLAEIKKVEEKYKFTPQSVEGQFCQGLKAIFKKALETWDDFRKGNKALKDLTLEKERLINKIIELLLLPVGHKALIRIRKRIIRHNQELFIFLDNPRIEPTNNRAERQLRPNVIMRKITFGNRTELGAKNHAVIMSIIQTGVLQGIEPLEIFRALSTKPLTSFNELPRPP